MNTRFAAASLLLLAATPAFSQALPWNPYHGKKPVPKPIIEHPIFPDRKTDGQGVQAPLGDGWDLYTGATPPSPRNAPADERSYGLRSTPALPDAWFDKDEYPNGPYGTRTVRAVVTGVALRATPLPIEIKLQDDLRYWERCLIGVDEKIRIANQRMRSIAPMKDASTEHRIAFYDVEDELKELYRDAQDMRGFRDEVRGLLDQLRRELQTVRDTVIVWQIATPQDHIYVPKDYLQEKALRYVQEHPEVIGREIALRF